MIERSGPGQLAEIPRARQIAAGYCRAGLEFCRSARDLLEPGNLWKVYVLIASPAILALCILMPPFQVNDEFQHFFRSYQISEGTILGIAKGHVAGGYLPRSLMELVKTILGSTGLYTVHPIMAEPLSTTFRLIRVPLSPHDQEFTDFSATVLYAPVGYLPQAFGILVARAFGAGVLGCFYAGRICNGLTAVFLMTLAMRAAPMGQYALFLVALLPTVLYLDASVSQDPGLIACAMMFVVLCMRAYGQQQWNWKSGIMAAGCGTVLVASKIAYAPMLGLALAPLFSARRTTMPMAPFLIIGVCLVLASLWVILSHPLMVWDGNGNSVSGQLSYVSDHPWRFAATILRTSVMMGAFYLKTGTSSFVGWPTEIQLPLLSFCLILVAVAALPISGDAHPRFSRVYFILSLLCLAISAVCVLVLLYLLYEPVGDQFVGEVQGRHFIPLFPFAAILVSQAASVNRTLQAERFARCFILTVCLFNISAYFTLICRSYHLFG